MLTRYRHDIVNIAMSTISKKHRELDIPHHRLAKMEYFYSWKERLLYGNWNRHVCHKGKYAADRPSRSTRVDLRRKQRCCSQPYLKLSGIHLTKIILKTWLLINMSSIYRYAKLNWDANCFSLAESKDCMNSASYECRNMSARRGA